MGILPRPANPRPALIKSCREPRSHSFLTLPSRIFPAHIPQHFARSPRRRYAPFSRKSFFTRDHLLRVLTMCPNYDHRDSPVLRLKDSRVRSERPSVPRPHPPRSAHETSPPPGKLSHLPQNLFSLPFPPLPEKTAQGRLSMISLTHCANEICSYPVQKRRKVPFGTFLLCVAFRRFNHGRLECRFSSIALRDLLNRVP